MRDPHFGVFGLLFQKHVGIVHMYVGGYAHKNLKMTKKFFHSEFFFLVMCSKHELRWSNLAGTLNRLTSLNFCLTIQLNSTTKHAFDSAEVTAYQTFPSHNLNDELLWRLP